MWHWGSQKPLNDHAFECPACGSAFRCRHKGKCAMSSNHLFSAESPAGNTWYRATKTSLDHQGCRATLFELALR